MTASHERKGSPRRFFLVLVLCVGSSACLAKPTLSVIPGYGFLGASGDVSASPSGVPNASASLSSLGLEQEEGAFLPRAEFDWSRVHVTAQALDVGFAGDGMLTTSLDFGGGGIAAGTPVHSELDVKLYSASAVFDILPRFIVEAGIGAGVGLFSSRLAVQSQSGPQAFESSLEDLPIGFLSGRIAKRFLGFELVATADGVSFDFEGDELTFYDVDVRAGYTLFSRGLDWSLLAGFRLYHFDFDYGDQGGEFRGDIDISGPYLGLSVTL